MVADITVAKVGLTAPENLHCDRKRLLRVSLRESGNIVAGTRRYGGDSTSMSYGSSPSSVYKNGYMGSTATGETLLSTFLGAITRKEGQQSNTGFGK